MKKTFWGYDPREVNEAIEFLESQNETMSAKITNLNLELSAKNEQLSAKTEEAEGLTAQEKKELDTLRASSAKLNEDNKRLKSEADALAAKLKRLEGDSKIASAIVAAPVQGQDELEQVGAICRAAYADMAQAKQQTAEEMKRFTEQYFEKWDQSDAQMRRIIADIKEAELRAKDSFVATVEEILSQFESFGLGNADAEAELDHANAVKEQLTRQVEDMIEALSAVEEETEPETEPEEQQPPAPILPPLLSKALASKKEKAAPSEETEETQPSRSIVKLKPKADKKIGDGSVMGISVDVNAKDVFSANM